MIKKTLTTKRPSPVVTMSFEPGNFIEFKDTKPAAAHSPATPNNHKHVKPRKASVGKKPTVAVHDRRRLKDIEIFLNNCLNLANAIETRRATAIIRLLHEAREESIRLRG